MREGRRVGNGSSMLCTAGVSVEHTAQSCLPDGRARELVSLYLPTAETFTLAFLAGLCRLRGLSFHKKLQEVASCAEISAVGI